MVDAKSEILWETDCEWNVLIGRDAGELMCVCRAAAAFNVGRTNVSYTWVSVWVSVSEWVSERARASEREMSVSRQQSTGPRTTYSSSVVTRSHPPTISSLKVTDCSFRYASPRLWNQLPDSFCQPHQSCLDSPPHSLVNPSLSSSLLSASITPGSKPTFSTNPSHLNSTFLLIGLPSWWWDWTGCYHAHQFILIFALIQASFIRCVLLERTCQ